MNISAWRTNFWVLTSLCNTLSHVALWGSSSLISIQAVAMLRLIITDNSMFYFGYKQIIKIQFAC